MHPAPSPPESPPLRAPVRELKEPEDAQQRREPATIPVPVSRVRQTLVTSDDNMPVVRTVFSVAMKSNRTATWCSVVTN